MNRTTQFMSLLALLAVIAASGPDQGGKPIIGKSTPAFSLPDSRGKNHKLTEFRGRNLVLFFYCGCEPCHECAKLWLEMTRSGGIPAPLPRTAAVFTGDASESRKFTDSVGWDASSLLLLDPHMKVAKAYDAEVCPRVFVLDSKGLLRYSNTAKGSRPGEASAATILSGVVTALREMDRKPGKSQMKPVHKSRPGRQTH